MREVRRAGGDFIKIMTTGILDFATKGHVTSEPLSREEVFAMTAAAHDAGLSVMAHVNGAQAVMDAAEAGVDSVEHGNFQNEGEHLLYGRACNNLGADNCDGFESSGERQISG